LKNFQKKSVYLNSFIFAKTENTQMKKQNNILSDDYDYVPKKPKIRHFKSKQISLLELDNEEVHYQQPRKKQKICR
jgi:hypothetical protein